MSPRKDDAELLEVDGREVRISSPGKVVFREPGLTKLDLVRYYLAVADGAVRGVADRPMVLKRFVKGIDQEAFFQKRVPENRPEWLATATLHYASGTSAEEAVVNDAAGYNERQTLIDRSKSEATFANIFGAVTLLSAGAGITLYLMSDFPKTDDPNELPPQPKAALRFSPLPRGGGMMNFEVAF